MHRLLFTKKMLQSGSPMLLLHDVVWLPRTTTQKKHDKINCHALILYNFLAEIYLFCTYMAKIITTIESINPIIRALGGNNGNLVANYNAFIG